MWNILVGVDLFKYYDVLVGFFVKFGLLMVFKVNSFFVDVFVNRVNC